jgi:hypothetical protein
MLLTSPTGAASTTLGRKVVGELLSGTKDGVNDIFFTSQKFIQLPGTEFSIVVRWAGRRLYLLDDYLVAESGGLGTGYDSIQLLYPIKPLPKDKITADYYPA